MKVDGATDLSPGTALNFHYPGEDDSAILVRAKDGNYYAYGQKCTHLSCPVYYSKSHDRLECPCHEGGFDVHDGKVLYGPPPRPLDRIEMEVNGGEVWAIGRKERGSEHES
jgi:nitrite reductase/ring-hydroxylating ferredoxin subunit